MPQRENFTSSSSSSWFISWEAANRRSTNIPAKIALRRRLLWSTRENTRAGCLRRVWRS